MRKMASIVPEAIGRDEVLKAGRAMHYLRQWPEIVGPLLASKSLPERFDHGTVWVAVTSPEWAQELRMHKSVILAKLRNSCGETDLFKEIRFGVRDIPSLKTAGETGELEESSELESEDPPPVQE